MSETARFEFFDFKPAHRDMASEVLEGLESVPKTISPKYFYDARGSALFEQITELPEYYLTRVEMALFDAHLPRIARIIGHDVCVIEYGSGSSRKIRKLLESLSPAAYVPVDISSEHLQENARELARDYPELDVFPVCADITQRFELPQVVHGLTAVGFFPGSSIGNFEPQLAIEFLRNVHDTIGPGGHLLIGVDRKKSPEVLNAAYNDAAGVTAAFNLNVLAHINARLGAGFDVDGFEHEAHYDEDAGCVRMYLVCRRAHTVEVAGREIPIAAGERLHTEDSYKYASEEFEALGRAAGFVREAAFTDAQDWFSLYLLRAE